MSNPNKARTTSDLLETAERREHVLRLRRGGASYPEIARAMERQFKGRLPNGWDQRYAYKDVKRELEKLRTEINDAAEDVRQLELERLDNLLKSLWEDAYVHGDYKAVDRVLKIMDRRARYLGLDAPDQHAIDLGDIVIRWPGDNDGD
jgi:hypothetical protein